jgi:hypothetical protein
VLSEIMTWIRASARRSSCFVGTPMRAPSSLSLSATRDCIPSKITRSENAESLGGMFIWGCGENSELIILRKE